MPGNHALVVGRDTVGDVLPRRRRARRAGFLIGRAIGRLRAEHEAGAQEGSRAEELERLADLRDRGVLTADEFEREKRRLLEG
jgi:hypothetical protein